MPWRSTSPTTGERSGTHVAVLLHPGQSLGGGTPALLCKSLDGHPATEEAMGQWNRGSAPQLGRCRQWLSACRCEYAADYDTATPHVLDFSKMPDEARQVSLERALTLSLPDCIQMSRARTAVGATSFLGFVKRVAPRPCSLCITVLYHASYDLGSLSYFTSCMCKRPCGFRGRRGTAACNLLRQCWCHAHVHIRLSAGGLCGRPCRVPAVGHCSPQSL